MREIEAMEDAISNVDPPSDRNGLSIAVVERRRLENPDDQQTKQNETRQVRDRKKETEKKSRGRKPAKG